MANKKEPSKFSQKVDAFCKALFLTEEGKPKSAALLYSFCLCLLFFCVYLATDVACVLLLNGVFTENSFLVAAVEYLLPGLIAGILCVCACFLFRENKQYVSSAFIWLCFLTLAVCVAMPFFCDAEDLWLEYRLFLQLLILPWLVFLVLGTGVSQWVVRRWRRAQEAQLKAAASKRPSYYA